MIISDGNDTLVSSTRNTFVRAGNNDSDHQLQLTSTLTQLNADSNILAMRNGSTVFNESKNNVDFAIHGDSLENVFYVDASTDRIGLGTDSPTQRLDVNSSGIRIRHSQTPASGSAAGNQGDIVWDTNYVYICVETNTWKRSALSTF